MLRFGSLHAGRSRIRSHNSSSLSFLPARSFESHRNHAAFTSAHVHTTRVTPSSDTSIAGGQAHTPNKKFVFISPFNGRRSNDAPPTAATPPAGGGVVMSRVLPLRSLRPFESSRSLLRMSPWISDSKPYEYTEQETRVSKWNENHTMTGTMSVERFRLLSTSWTLDWKDTRLHNINVKHDNTHTYYRVHRRPERQPKSLVRRCLELCLSLMSLVGFSWFYITHLESIPIVGRSHFVGLTPDQEEWIGEWMLQEMLQDVNVLNDPFDPRVHLVSSVGTRIASVAEQPDWNWRFYVVESPQVNAVCFPGGAVVVFTGLLDLIYKRQETYKAKMVALGLKPITGTYEPESPSASSSSSSSRSSSLFGSLSSYLPSWSHTRTDSNLVPFEDIPADAWPWPDPADIPDIPTLRHSIRALFNPASERNTSVTSGGGTSDTAKLDRTLRKYHPHEVDVRGLHVDRDYVANQLAVVLGHEVGHAIARHSGERLSWLPFVGIINLINDSSPLLSRLSDWFFTLPYSRLQETEADEIGIILMSRACYHPGVSGAFWSDFTGSKYGQHYFSTHPPDDLRAHHAKVWYEKAKEEMRRCCK